MKKQLLIAAVAATMATVSIADVSITGSGKLNYLNTDVSASADGTVAASTSNAFGTDLALTVTGKSGDTSVVFTQEFNDQASVEPSVTGTQQGTVSMQTKAAYMKSNIAGVNVKAGSWISSDTNMSNGTIADGRFSADYTVSGVKVQYEDRNGEELANPSSFTVSGAVQGVSLSHEMFVNEDTDTKVSGSIAGVNIAYRAYDVDTAATTTQDKESIVVDYTTNGITLTYADVDVDGIGTTTSDAFFGTQASPVGDMTGFGVSTAIAGNTIALKSYTINPDNAATSSDDDYTKVVITRPLASGATFEATYTDKDAGNNDTADQETLDLELAVKF
ncbi:hypothetical protein SP60_01315 [Candidatus Thioglobus autotrophicus]|uniref:Porin domain-containing protein n=1 Tax=Candidatus Thioglobus autotrophicus TaxID=1705394 RepID=A0A0M4NW98_9GAMM|nr:hypothetical protein [Candidatus Thioglobus autotrophicus]ALE52002.1 hypothetical protein SP60_01315 [Candidatus Thioglobus autotrophicus]